MQLILSVRQSMFDHKKILDEILSTKNGIHVNSVHFVSDEMFEKNENDKFRVPDK